MNDYRCAEKGMDLLLRMVHVLGLKDSQTAHSPCRASAELKNNNIWGSSS